MITIDYAPQSAQAQTEGGVPAKAARRKLTQGSTRAAEQAAAWAAEVAAMEAAEAIRAAGEQRLYTSHSGALVLLGQAVPEGSGRKTFATIGCVAVMLGIIAEGGKTRSEIVELAHKRYRYSYRHCGFLLTKLTGTDPSQHLWFRDEDARYRVLTQ